MKGTPQQRWYVTVLVVRARVNGERRDDDLVDHQVRLLHCADPEAAYERALALGTAEEHSYRNADGALVSWEFCGLADLDEVQADELADGVEIYSWRSTGQREHHVLPREKLAVFWLAANGERSITDLRD